MKRWKYVAITIGIIWTFMALHWVFIAFVHWNIHWVSFGRWIRLTAAISGFAGILAWLVDKYITPKE